jgi:hypothetical protein
VHHLLLARGFGHVEVTLICVLVNVFFVALAYFGRSLGSTTLLFIMLAISFTGLGLLYYRRPLRTMVIAKRNGTTELKTPSKVVTLSQETEVATADQK